MHVLVNDIMTTEVTSVSEETPFQELAETLIDKDVSAVPVLDARDRVVGVVSEADLLRKEEFREQYTDEGYRQPFKTRLRRRLDHEPDPARKAAGTLAADIMSSPAVTVAPAASVGEAARMMDRQGVKRMPVVDASARLIGIVSRHDLLKVFVRGDDEIEREINDEVILRTLWCGPDEITVTVKEGIVVLEGSVDRRSTAEIAARMCGRIDGVVDVTDRLSWKVDDTKREWRH